MIIEVIKLIKIGEIGDPEEDGKVNIFFAISFY